MKSENKTVEDFVREMRKHLKEWDDEGNPSPFTEELCDILISAHRREVAELDRKVHEHHLAFLAEKARHTDTYKDERIRAQDAEIASLKGEVAELRECLKEAITRFCTHRPHQYDDGFGNCESLKNGSCECSECWVLDSINRWRKALAAPDFDVKAIVLGDRKELERLHAFSKEKAKAILEAHNEQVAKAGKAG